jgi:hypothetical protein
MIAVVATTQFDLATAFLPKTGLVATGAGRVYRLYATGVVVDRQYADLDGDVLVEVRGFDDERAAKEWVALDVAWRSARAPEKIQ